MDLEKDTITVSIVIPVKMHARWKHWASTCGIPLSQYIQGAMEFALRRRLAVKRVRQYENGVMYKEFLFDQ